MGSRGAQEMGMYLSQQDKYCGECRIAQRPRRPVCVWGGGTEETFRAGDLHRLSVVGPWGRSHGK